ncbi:GNAT family N-acetyltransferase [Streptomyces sp. EAS-AB2608]|uniref:GNAT family N-acetyltransferase n=1 Tax=Streptomyces sp. EAS-AB2608 TaxID=2779671 RepID=UPI001C846BAE
MRADPGRTLDASWLAACRDQLATRLHPGGDARAYVIDATDGGLASCALAFLQPLLPAPKYPKGLAARIHAVAAEPSYRRRGYAKAALATLLEHLEQHSVTRYERPCTKGSVSGPTPRSCV